MRKYRQVPRRPRFHVPDAISQQMSSALTVRNLELPHSTVLSGLETPDTFHSGVNQHFHCSTWSISPVLGEQLGHRPYDQEPSNPQQLRNYAIY